MRDIELLHPKLREKAEQMLRLCSERSLIIGIAQTFRTVEEQNELYAQGRSKEGSIVTNAKGTDYDSMHQWGVAFDIYRDDGKGAYYNADGFFSKAGEIGRSLGLEWGGDWKEFKDLPHFQLPDWGSTPIKLKKMYGNPDNFIKTWGDYEMVSEGYIRVNGKNIKINQIVKEEGTYIAVRGLESAGFNVNYNAATKLITLNNKPLEPIMDFNGEKIKVRAVNIEGTNYINLRELSETTGLFDVGYEDGKVKIKSI